MIVLPSNVLAMLDSGRIVVRKMLWVDLASGPAGVWNDTYDVTYSGVVYKGLAGNLDIDPIPGSTELNTDQVRITMTGLDPDALALVAPDEWYQRACVVYDAYLDDTGQIMHVEPAFAGFLDTVQIMDQAGEPATIELSAESTNRELDRAGGRKYSDNDQRLVGGATDGFLKHLTVSNADTDIYWGRVNGT